MSRLIVVLGLPWRAVIYAFVAGAAAALCVLSLVQDAMGLQAWQAWEAREWAPATATVPAAICGLLLAADAVRVALRGGSR